MTLVQLFLIHRYKASAVHYLTPTEDNESQTQKMKSMGIFSDVQTEVGQIIVADVNKQVVDELLKPDRAALLEMIRKTSSQTVAVSEGSPSSLVRRSVLAAESQYISTTPAVAGIETRLDATGVAHLAVQRGNRTCLIIRRTTS